MASFNNVGLQLDGTLQTVYTYVGSASATLVGMRIANKDGVNSADIDVFFNDGATDFYISGKDTPIPAMSALELLAGSKVILTNGDSIKAQASATGDLDVVLSFMDFE